MAAYGCDAKALDITDRAAVQRAVRSFIPDAKVLAICGHDWRHDRYSLETWAVFRPGQISRDERYLQMAEGRLVFAGAHTALRWTGFIDGAIESGIRAAHEAGAFLQREGTSRSSKERS
jgi:monoamine oxidase